MQADVLIVGCGPVGKMIAIQVARAGHPVVIAERQSATYALPRAVTHDAEVGRILQSVGLAPCDIDDITQPYDDLYTWLNAADDVLLEVDWRGLGESGWYNTYFFHQPALESRLLRTLQRMANVDIMWGCEYVEHREVGDVVEVDLQGLKERQTVSARYLIGADGAGSKVRAHAGIGWHDVGYFFDWLVVDVKPRADHPIPHVARQRCDHSRPYTMVPGGPGRRRWEFMKLPAERVEDINRAEFAWRLLSEQGMSPDQATLERHAHYRFQAGWAQRWRSGRVLLAGDAAHLMPPFAGQGLGAGLRDAMNLSWKLRSVLSGVAHEALLETYPSERMSHVAEFIRFSVALGEVICVTDPVEAAARDRRMIAERAAGVSPPVPPRPRLGPGLHTGSHGGTLSIQASVIDARGHRRRLDDALGGPGALLVRHSEMLHELSAADISALNDVGVTPCQLGEPSLQDARTGVRAVTDTDGRYGAWLRSLSADAVLIRPDFYVYGTADCPAGVARLVASLREGMSSVTIGATS